MRENRLLFKVKSLEKMIFRTFIHDSDLLDRNIVLTPTQMQIMEYILFKSDGKVLQRDLEVVLNLRRATVSGVLQTMEKNGLVERVTDNFDARNKKIILNHEAKEIFEKHEKEMEKIEELVIKGISEEELEVFSTVLDKMKDNINKVNVVVAEKGELEC